MFNTYFIQFYENNHWGREDICVLTNGFSNAYHYCKNIGDFLWVNRGKMNEVNFPFTSGTVYISLLFLPDLYQVIEWAKDNPNIKFVGGGPAILSRKSIRVTDYETLFPKNLHITPLTVEQYFELEPNKDLWGLDISQIDKNDLKNVKEIYFSYSIDVRCYWKKCNFCSYHFSRNEYIKKDKYIDLKVIDKIDSDFPLIVKLTSPSLNKHYLNILIPQFKYNDKLTYEFAIRCDSHIHQVLWEKLKGLTKPPKLRVSLGLEYPTDRMLQFMNKGFSLQDIINMVNLLKDYNSIISAGFIIGWPTLTWDDVTELCKSSEEIQKIDYGRITRLVFQDGTKFYNQFIDRAEKSHFFGEFMDYYEPYLDEEENETNFASIEIMDLMGINISHLYKGRL